MGWIKDRVRHLRFQFDLFRAYRANRRFQASYPHMTRDIPYHAEMLPRLDVYSPPAGDGHAVLILVHGGSWCSLSKETFAVGGQRLTPYDLVVVIPDYTLYPQARYGQMANEVAAAVAWTLEHIAEYGGDPGRIVLSGHSAGGHLAALAAMDDAYLPPLGHRREEIRGLVGMSGVYDIAAEYAFSSEGGDSSCFADIFGGTDGFGPASPISLARPDMPPVLLIHGDQDDVVPLHIGTDFCRALQAAGAKCELRVYPGAGHADYLFDLLTREQAPVLDDIVRFVGDCTR